MKWVVGGTIFSGGTEMEDTFDIASTVSNVEAENGNSCKKDDDSERVPSLDLNGDGDSRKMMIFYDIVIFTKMMMIFNGHQIGETPILVVGS